MGRFTTELNRLSRTHYGLMRIRLDRNRWQERDQYIQRLNASKTSRTNLNYTLTSEETVMEHSHCENEMECPFITNITIIQQPVYKGKIQIYFNLFQLQKKQTNKFALIKSGGIYQIKLNTLFVFLCKAMEREREQ